MNTLRKSGWPARMLAALVVLVVLVLARFLIGAGAPLHLADDRVGTQHSSGGSQARASEADPSRPNIVFILTDDLSMDLLPYMPHVLAMEQQGLSFSNYFVSDSLCCPSRASILSGRFPHDTGVLANFGPHGGFPAFHDRGEERSTFAVALHRDGYVTAMMGKYLNGYMQPAGQLGCPESSPLTTATFTSRW